MSVNKIKALTKALYLFLAGKGNFSFATFIMEKKKKKVLFDKNHFFKDRHSAKDKAYTFSRNVLLQGNMQLGCPFVIFFLQSQ